LFVLLLVFLTGSYLDDPITANPDQPFPLKIGERVLIEPGGLEIQFLRVEEDSRCPAGVNCIWAGQATVVLLLKSSAGESLQATLTGFNVEEKMRASLGGYTVRFQALLPRPNAGEPTRPADYLVTMVVTAA